MNYYTDLLTIIENNSMFIGGSDVSLLQEVRERINHTDKVLSAIEGCTDDLTDERRLRMERTYDYFIALHAELVKKAQYLINKYIGTINLYFKKNGMKEITKTELKRKGVQFTEDSPFPLPYVTDCIDVNGGYLTMYVPTHLGLTKKDIKECSDYIKREQDVVKLTIVNCKLINI